MYTYSVSGYDVNNKVNLMNIKRNDIKKILIFITYASNAEKILIIYGLAFFTM